MASIPVTSYSATKVHDHVKKQQQRGDKRKADPGSTNFRTETFDVNHVPPNYNSKLMNSIWGMYNLYASHAFQKNSEGVKAAADFALPQAKTFSLWDFIKSAN